MDVATWLQGLGLERHEAAFRDNLVDMDVVRELTENDLEKLGLALGDRKRILKAIASLSTLEPAAPAIPIAATRVRDKAERRPVTVMFCDLVGSTSLAATLDAEDWRDLVGGYLDAASAAVKEMGGHVAKKLGDGIMALFGRIVIACSLNMKFLGERSDVGIIELFGVQRLNAFSHQAGRHQQAGSKLVRLYLLCIHASG